MPGLPWRDWQATFDHAPGANAGGLGVPAGLPWPPFPPSLRCPRRAQEPARVRKHTLDSKGALPTSDRLFRRLGATTTIHPRPVPSAPGGLGGLNWRGCRGT